MKRTNIIESEIPKSTKLGNFIHIQKGVAIGENTRICNYANLYGCEIGSDCMIGSFVEVQSMCSIGNRSRVSSHSFLCSNVTIEEDVFISHHNCFCNDSFYNYQVNFNAKEWGSILVKKGAIIGSQCVILPNVVIGENSIIGAGSVVTKSIPDNSIAYGNPCRVIRKIPVKYELNQQENIDIA